jgi:signal transduction histidine kinase
MDVLFDYRPSTDSDLSVGAREQVDDLLACYQQALGHELPNLLVALQGMARLIAAEHAAGLDADGRALLARVADLARRADFLARATASVGRVCRGANATAAVPLSDAVREALAEVNLAFPAANVEYVVAPEMPVLKVSRRAIHQMLVQLLTNAFRAALPDRPLQVTVTARRTGCGVEIRVADNGRGVPVEIASRLGQPFAAGTGPGLGLFMVRQLVAARGGSLHVTSEPGQGTAVTILFNDAVPCLAALAPEAR